MKLTHLLCAVVLLSTILPSALYADSACASVKLEIRQELTLERQAFDAHMRINNGLAGVSLEEVGIDVSFKGASGNTVLAISDPANTIMKVIH